MLLLLCRQLSAQTVHDTVYVDWQYYKGSGVIDASFGTIEKLVVKTGKASIKKNSFSKKDSGALRLMIVIGNVKKDPGPEATLIHIRTQQNPFSFFLRDVNQSFPIYLPAYEVAVFTVNDNRNYSNWSKEIKARGLSSALARMEIEPETDFKLAQQQTRDMHTPTWLGISRDIRIFQLSENLPGNLQETNLITPQWAAYNVPLAEMKDKASNYMFNAGRGHGVQLNTRRWLEDSVLPVLHSIFKDDELVYHSTAFVTLEQSELNAVNIKGTDYLVADNYSHGHMFTESQQKDLQHRLKNAFDTAETTVFTYRCIAKNTAGYPKYAWFKIPRPGSQWWEQYKYQFDASTGFSSYAEDRVFCVSLLNGKPVRNEELAVLLQPGEEAVFDFFLPHTPISKQRAVALGRQTFTERLTAATHFWNTKLQQAARITVPEQRINNMLRAGLLHLDLITYGKEPDSTLAPCIGVYSPIGTESSPIIQFYASMGLHQTAKRSLNYFLAKQHDDGMIQNFGGYMVETGAALWSMGEYYRYTRDAEWVKSNQQKIIKACDYLFAWRNRNKKEELRNRGYGMIDGKVADPEDQFHQFMLNGYAYLGCSRVAEMLKDIDPRQSARIKAETLLWRQDIRQSFFYSMAQSPVVPLADGSWTPTVAPWPEMIGPRALFVNKDRFFSHGTFTTADALLGPLYLSFCEVLEPGEPENKNMLAYHNSLFYQDNAAFSQPYYSRHNWLQAKLGLVKPFLRTYYNSVAALADRETYTFWEHLFKVSVHKTHEEAWFLMETRWMLYMEEGDQLQLLKTIPRNWLEDGKKIELKNVSSYFGKLNIQVASHVDEGYIKADIACPVDRGLKSVTLRVPHPEGKKAIRVDGGTYNAANETITVDSFNGSAEIVIRY